jgi:hypothetical protein
LPPIQFRGNGNKAFGSEFTACQADVFVDAEDLVKHDDYGRQDCDRRCNVSGELAALGLDIDRLTHVVCSIHCTGQ